MKRVLLFALVCLGLNVSTPISWTQSMSHEEEIVRNTYAKLTFLSGIWPLTQTIIAGPDKPVDLVKFKEISAKETPLFTLGDFRVGPIADIANQPWSTFVSSQAGTPVLRAAGIATATPMTE